MSLNVLSFSWVFPLHLLKNKYKLTMILSFAGTIFTYLFLGAAYASKSMIILYFALPAGMFIGYFLALIEHIKLQSLIFRK